MMPYYDRGGVRLLHADCREGLRTIAARLIATSPVWTGASKEMDDPAQLKRDRRSGHAKGGDRCIDKVMS